MVTIKHAIDDLNKSELVGEGICTTEGELIILLEELQRLRDAEEQGLLPRFHLGDEFWTTRLDRVVKAKVVMLQQKKDGTWRYRFSQEISPKYHDTSDYEELDYGRYFFNTKEEAEKLAKEEQKKWEEELKRLEEKRKQN